MKAGGYAQNLVAKSNRDFSLVTSRWQDDIIRPCKSPGVERSLKTLSIPSPEILVTPPVAQDLISFVGLVKVSINASANSKTASSGLCSDESSEIPARFAGLMVRRINRVVDTNPSDCHFGASSPGDWLPRIVDLMPFVGAILRPGLLGDENGHSTRNPQ